MVSGVLREMDLQDSFPGCMGRMINLFDLNSGVSRTKLLVERPYRDVRNCPDVARDIVYPVEVKPENNQLVGEQRSLSPKKTSGGTPVKMLISQEMWGDRESIQKPPSVVARLMGLDSLPAHQTVKNREVRSMDSLCDSSIEFQNRQQYKGDYVDKSFEGDSQSSTDEEAFRDVYEVQQPQRPSKNVWINEQFPHKARYEENSYQRRMTLVRQKFIEAKRLATNEKFIDSKEFQDAVEVLNSNRDLFLKFLEEPNSLFTKHIFELQTVPLPSQKTSITVLKPFGAAEKKRDKSTERHLLVDPTEPKGNRHYWSSSFSQPKGQNLSQPTRIVVLKPSPSKPKVLTSAPPNNFPRLMGGQVPSGVMVNDELAGSREVAKEITRQMRESLSGNKDEAFLSSVLSNGYVGDESSFHRSESECLADEVRSTSDSEITTPVTEYSCDCVNKIGSPFSGSSFSRASHSPESSVIREAKKRLSERLALVTSNDSSQDHRQLRRTSSTLGEMLAIPEIKNEGNEGELAPSSSRSFNGENESEVSHMFEEKGKHSEDDSPRNLSRSKSVPHSCSACEAYELNERISSSLNEKANAQLEVPKTNRGRSSFRDKVSSFFFPKGKKHSGEKFLRSHLTRDDSVQVESSSGSGKTDNDSLPFATVRPSSDIPARSDTLHDGSTEGISSPKGVFSLEKPDISRKLAKDEDLSNQRSILETPLINGANNGISRSAGSIIAGRPQALSRSPQIESVARSLSWGASYLDAASAKPVKPLIIFHKADEEHNQFVFVHKLISSAGLDSRESMMYGGWHSLDSPLNPSLLYDSMQRDEEEGKCRESRSIGRLLFDAVNAALLDISQCEFYAACHGPKKQVNGGISAAEQVWAIVRNRLWSDKRVPSESITSSILVDRLVKKEVAGREWIESMWLEVCEFCKEIGGKVLDELVEEALSELSQH